MVRNLLILPDGTEVSSGSGQAYAIKNISYTQCVNSAQDLVPGAVCANMLEAEIIAPAGCLQIQAGQELQWYKVDEENNRVLQGWFLLEKPERPSANCLRLTGYDRVVRLDKDLTGWLAGLTDWPYTLEEFANLVCSVCGAELVTEDIPNGDHYIQKFTAEGITGRQLMGWIAQAAGRFCRATVEGALELAWYTPVDITIGPDSSYTGFYYQDSLKFQDYATEPIVKVQLRQSAEDVGTVYPDGEGNTLILEGNPLLSAEDGDSLAGIAQNLYEQFQGISYTPCSFTVPTDCPVEAGQILQLTDRNGKAITCYVMKCTLSGQRRTLECTGNRRRDDTTAVNDRQLQALSGKVLHLRTDVDGIRAENKNMQGDLAALQLDLDGISSEVVKNQEEVGGLKSAITQMQQNAEGLSISVQNIIRSGVDQVTTKTGYTFNQDGLEITKSGQQMKNKLDNTGMVVSRSGTPILTATADGVEATDVKVNNYLIIGNCRFEDYTDGTDSRRTACFFTGEGG